MGRYSEDAWERAMKVLEVILRAMAKRITWWQAAEIIGISDPPVAIQAQAVETHDEHVARLGAFYVKRAREDVTGIKNQLARFVTPARIEALGDHSIPGAHVGERWVRGREGYIVAVGRNVVSFAVQR